MKQYFVTIDYEMMPHFTDIWMKQRISLLLPAADEQNAIKQVMGRIKAPKRILSTEIQKL